VSERQTDRERETERELEQLGRCTLHYYQERRLRNLTLQFAERLSWWMTTVPCSSNNNTHESQLHGVPFLSWLVRNR